MKTMLIAVMLALCSLTGCIASTGGTPATQATEIARWRDSVAFWQNEVNVAENLLATSPDLSANQKADLAKQIDRAKWWVSFFQALIPPASTQTAK